MRRLPLYGLLAAAMLAAPLPALAQSADPSDDLDTMQQGMSMLETSVGNQLQRYGIDTDPQSLTLAQLATLHGILTGTDEGSKEQRIRGVIEN